MNGRDKFLTLAVERTRPAKTSVFDCHNPCRNDTYRPAIWIRTVAGPNIGFGHLRRSLTLAHLLSDTFLPVFVADPGDPWTQAQALACDWRSVIFGEESLGTHEQLPAALIIDTREEKGLHQIVSDARRHRIPVISIHDLGLNPLPSDLVVDGSALPVAYDKSWPDSECRYGTSYLVLDPSFARLHDKRKSLKKQISRVVVNLGGGDSRKYYPKVLRGLRNWNRDLEVIGVPGFTDWGQRLLQRRGWRPLRFRWARRDEAVHELLFSADIAVTAGGLSAFEALCVGTPLLAVAFDELQQVTLAALAKVKSCVDLGLAASLDPRRLTDALTSLETDIALRQRLSMCGRQVVDGRGAERVTALIRHLVFKRLKRPVGMKLA